MKQTIFCRKGGPQTRRSSPIRLRKSSPISHEIQVKVEVNEITSRNTLIARKKEIVLSAFRVNMSI